MQILETKINLPNKGENYFERKAIKWDQAPSTGSGPVWPLSLSKRPCIVHFPSNGKVTIYLQVLDYF